MIVFGYRNRTDNGTEKTVGSKEAAEAKIISLRAQYPHVEWELLEIEIRKSRQEVWLPGRGRAGNSYRSSREVNTVGKAKVLGVY